MQHERGRSRGLIFDLDGVLIDSEGLYYRAYSQVLARYGVTVRRDEYETHIRDKKCLSGVCKQIVSFEVNQETCKMCNICKKSTRRSSTSCRDVPCAPNW